MVNGELDKGLMVNFEWKVGKKVKGKKAKGSLYGISRFVGAEWHFCPKRVNKTRVK